MTTETERAEIELATPKGDPPQLDEYRLMMYQAKHLVDSRLLPSQIDTPQKAITIIRKGRELGLPDLYALSNITVIDGKPTLMADAMLTLVYRKFGGNAIRVVETSSEKAVVRYKRPEWDEPSTLEFTIEDAKTAGLLGNPRSAWSKYPANMLRWRAISAAAKLGFPDVLAGLYTPEELGVPVEISAAGESWIDVEASEPAARLVDSETGEIVETTPEPERPTRTFSQPLPPAAEAEAERARQRVAEQVEASKTAPPVHPGKGRSQLLDSVLALCEELVPLRGKGEDKLRVLRAACNANDIAVKKPGDLSVDQLSTLLNWLTTQIDIFRNSEEGGDMAEEALGEETF